MDSLFQPLKLGALELQHRIIMAPLTRMRSQAPANTPWELNATYYGQRASAGGLIIAEATQISQQGQGYPATPGIHSAEQVAGWQQVTQAVHEKAGFIFLQLWHVGRISHSSFQPNGALPVAPSAIPASGKTMTASWGQVPYETPHALTSAEIESVLADFQQAAQNAKAAGFDGVEVHGANGYLLDQFLHDGSNQRTDAYGGTIENRARLLLQVVDSAVAIWGAECVGVRLSPFGTFNDMYDSNPIALFGYVLRQLQTRQLAYVHIIEPRATTAGGNDTLNDSAPSTSALFRDSYKGMLISAGGYTPANARAVIAEGKADAVAFGRLFIANPDLPARLRLNAALNPYDRNTFYGGDAKGYTDYPALNSNNTAA